MVHQPQSEDRSLHEKYLLENIEQFDIVSINRKDFSILKDSELRTLYEVCKDRKNYNLAKSNLTFDPKHWNDESRKDWIIFVSQKYVDNHCVDVSRGESPDFHKELKDYWTSQKEMWENAASIYDMLVDASGHRDQYDKISNLARLMNLTSKDPRLWNETDRGKFSNWYATDYRESLSLSRGDFFTSKAQQWIETIDAVKGIFGRDSDSETMEEETECEEMSPLSMGIPEYTPSPSPCQTYSEVPPSFYQTVSSLQILPDFGDPEDWDKELLNRWLQSAFTKFGVDFNSYRLAERHRRLVMIYIRCSWPCDVDKNALTGLCRVFNTDLGSSIYYDIIRMRPKSRVPDIVTKPDSQRHRNRRDLHLWEFLLILLANSEYECESIRWKDQSRGIFELANRHRIAKMWGLTKGNIKMTYDNMSRSVRQYYKDDKTGIMIRHQTGTASLGKYSYQFSMSNNEVIKLWKSLHSS